MRLVWRDVVARQVGCRLPALGALKHPNTTSAPVVLIFEGEKTGKKRGGGTLRWDPPYLFGRNRRIDAKVYLDLFGTWYSFQTPISPKCYCYITTNFLFGKYTNAR